MANVMMTSKSTWHANYSADTEGSMLSTCEEPEWSTSGP